MDEATLKIRRALQLAGKCLVNYSDLPGVHGHFFRYVQKTEKKRRQRREEKDRREDGAEEREKDGRRRGKEKEAHK